MRRSSTLGFTKNEKAVAAFLLDQPAKSQHSIAEILAATTAAGQAMNEATAYRIAHRMRQAGYMAHSWLIPDSDPSGDARPISVFSLTPAGRAGCTNGVYETAPTI